MDRYRAFTPPKFNIASETWWLEDCFPFGKVTFQYFSGVMLKFRWVYIGCFPSNSGVNEDFLLGIPEPENVWVILFGNPGILEGGQGTMVYNLYLPWN